MTQINIEKFKNIFTFEEIESIKTGIDNIENGKVYTEDEFYTRLEKRLYSNKKVHV